MSNNWPQKEKVEKFVAIGQIGSIHDEIRKPRLNCAGNDQKRSGNAEMGKNTIFYISFAVNLFNTMNKCEKHRKNRKNVTKNREKSIIDSWNVKIRCFASIMPWLCQFCHFSSYLIQNNVFETKITDKITK